MAHGSLCLANTPAGQRHGHVVLTRRAPPTCGRCCSKLLGSIGWSLRLVNGNRHIEENWMAAKDAALVFSTVFARKRIKQAVRGWNGLLSAMGGGANLGQCDDL